MIPCGSSADDLTAWDATALKNADPMLRDIIKAVDTNGDGYIDYPGKIMRRTSHSVSYPPLSVTGYRRQSVFQPNVHQNSGPSWIIPKSASGNCSTA